jgi:hypothetical protein
VLAATVTVSISKPGFYDGKFLVYSDGSSAFYDALSGSLKRMAPPNWSGVVHTPGGFNFTITNFYASLSNSVITPNSLSYSVTTTNGVFVGLPFAGTVETIVNGDFGQRFEVTNLGVGQKATVVVTIFELGFYDEKVLVSSDGSSTFCVGCTFN